MRDSNKTIDRRTALKMVSAGGIASIAGCLGNGDDAVNGDGVDDGDTDAAETLSLEVGGWPPDGSYLERIYIENFFEEVNNRLDDYQIDYTWHGGGSVVGGGEGFYGVRDGIVDMSFDLPTYYGSEMALANWLNNPFIWPVGDSDAANVAYNQMVQPGGFLSHYWENMDQICLTGGTNPGYQLFTQEEITSLDQLEGMVIRSGGGAMSLIIEALGAEPVETTAEETYETLEQGIAEGLIYPPVAIADASVHEVTDYMTTNMHLGGFPLTMSISQNRYNELPDTVQDTLLEVGEWTAEGLRDAIVGFTEDEIYANEDWFVDEGEPGDNQLRRYENEAQEEIHEAVQTVPEDWIAEQEAEGRDGEEFLERWVELLEDQGSYYPPHEN